MKVWFLILWVGSSFGGMYGPYKYDQCMKLKKAETHWMRQHNNYGYGKFKAECDK